MAMRAWSRHYRGNRSIVLMTKAMKMVIVMSRFLEGEMKNIMRERKVIIALFKANNVIIKYYDLYRFLKTKDLTWIRAKIE